MNLSLCAFRYKWYKDSTLLDANLSHVISITNEAASSLHLRVGQSDSSREKVAGSYQCQVSNDVQGAVAISDVSVLEERGEWQYRLDLFTAAQIAQIAWPI